MKKNTIQLTIVGLLTVFFCCSCSSPTVKTNFLPGTYVLGIDNPVAQRLPAYVHFTGSTMDGDPLPDGSVRALEIKKGISDLAMLLQKSRLFRSVEVTETPRNNPNEFLIEVSYVEIEDRHVAGAAVKGFASGFFTFGLVPVTFDYSFSSEMKIRVLKDGSEVLSNTSVKSADASGSHSSGEPMPERTLTRRFITDENNKVAVHFLVKNSTKLK